MVCTLNHESKVVLNSNLMIPDFPHNVRIRLPQLNFLGTSEHNSCCVLMLLCLCPFGFLSFEKLNGNSQQGRVLATLGGNKKKSIGPILFLYHEESLVSSNLNKTILVSLCRSEDQCIWTYFILSVPLIFFTGLGRVGAWKIPVSDSVVSFKHSPPPLGGPTVATSSLAPRR